MDQVEIDGLRVAYRERGSGPPLVLLHGWPVDRVYELKGSGRDLQGMLSALYHWGEQWLELGDENLVVEADSRTLVPWHLEHLEWAEARRSGRIRVSGPRSLAKALPTWDGRGFENSDTAQVVR